LEDFDNQFTSLISNLNAFKAKQNEEIKALEKRKQEIQAEIDNIRSIPSSVVKLNVGGSTYATSLSTLTKYPDSLLGNMFSGRVA